MATQNPWTLAKSWQWIFLHPCTSVRKSSHSHVSNLFCRGIGSQPVQVVLVFHSPPSRMIKSTNRMQHLHSQEFPFALKFGMCWDWRRFQSSNSTARKTCNAVLFTRVKLPLLSRSSHSSLSVYHSSPSSSRSKRCNNSWSFRGVADFISFLRRALGT